MSHRHPCPRQHHLTPAALWVVPMDAMAAVVVAAVAAAVAVWVVVVVVVVVVVRLSEQALVARTAAGRRVARVAVPGVARVAAQVAVQMATRVGRPLMRPACGLALPWACPMPLLPPSDRRQTIDRFQSCVHAPPAALAAPQWPLEVGCALHHHHHHPCR
jgi:hypothetical protein